MSDLTELWSRARPIVLPYEGGASQIYVFGIPFSEIAKAVQIFCRECENVTIYPFNNESGEGAIRPTDRVIEQITTRNEENCSHTLYGGWQLSSQLQLFLHLNGAETAFDVEFVFWADEIFPDESDGEACKAAFKKCIELAGKFGSLTENPECALTSCEGGDPREFRSRSDTIFW